MRIEHWQTWVERRERYDGIVRWAIVRVLRSCQNLSPPIVDYVFHGATHVHPRHLTIWFAFADPAALREARARGHCDAVRRTLLVVLRDGGYPIAALPDISIGFVSRKEVKEAGGPW